MSGNKKPAAATAGTIENWFTQRFPVAHTQTTHTAELLQRLAGVRQSGRGFLALCPAHEDRNPSLSITPAHDRLLLYCFAGCSVESITAAIGLSLSDLFFPDNGFHRTAERSPRIRLQSAQPTPDRGENPVRTLTFINRQAGPEPANMVGKVRVQPVPRRVEVRNRRQTAAFAYHDEAGNVLAVKRRYDFTAVYDDGSERREKMFSVSPAGLALPLYRLPAVLSAVRQGWRVCLAEGEAKADLLEAYFRHEWGSPATASSYGGHWRPDMAATLTGANVVLFPDRDEAGERKAERIIRDLYGVAASIALCDLSELLTALQAGEGVQ